MKTSQVLMIALMITLINGECVTKCMIENLIDRGSGLGNNVYGRS